MATPFGVLHDRYVPIPPRPARRQAGHLRAASAGAGTGAGRRAGRRMRRAPFPDAGIAWARVVGSLMALSGTLLDLGEWAEVRRLAAVLADIGEANAAVDLRIQLGKAVWDRHYDHLRRIHARMTPQEIAGSLATLRAVLRDVPEDFPE